MGFENLKRKINSKTPSLSYECSSDTFETAKAKVLAKVNALANIKLCDVQPATNIVVKEENGLIYKKIRFKMDEHTYVNTILLYHHEKTNLPTILIFPGKNSDIEELSGLQPARFADQNIVEYVAKSDCNAFIMDYGIQSEVFADRNNLDVYHLISGLTGTSPLLLAVESMLSIAKWMEGQPWFSRDRVGVFGRSMGGFIAAYFALLYETSTSVALANCLSSYKDLINNQYSINGASYIYGILNEVEFIDLILSLAPKTSLHLQYSRNDPFYPYENARKMTDQMEFYFDKYQLFSHLEAKETTYEHATDMNLIVNFFNKTIP